jgi:hypothetical protein
MEFQKMIIYPYASGRPKYICKHTSMGISTDSKDWLVWKYTDQDLPAMEGPRIGTAGVTTEAAINTLNWSI